MIKTENIRLLILLTGIMTLCACGETSGFQDEEILQDDVNVTVTVQFPNQVFTLSPQTKTNVSKTIEKLDIFAYDSNDKLVYRVTTNSIEDTEENSKKKVTVKLPYNKDTAYRLIFVANIDDEFIETNIAENSPKSLLIDLLHTNPGKWNNGTAIPMYGETANMIQVNSLNVTASVTLLRMLARIDLLMDLEDPNQFTLKEVWLYNSNTSGHIVPDMDKYNAGIPTLPDPLPGRTETPLLYEAAGDAVREIYTYELTQDKNENRQDAPCLVIGGIYSYDTQLTYYRVNIYEKTEDGKDDIYPDLLRNHLYYIKIKEIYGKGYDDKETALVSIPALNGELLTLDEGESSIIFDGDHFLSISEDRFEFTRNPSQGTLTIKTDLANWEVAVDESAADWLKIENNINGLITFSLTENKLTETREGYIRVKAGDFRQEILVIQTTDDLIALSIRDRNGKDITELIFASHANDLSVIAQELIVSWSPATSICMISSTDGDIPFEYGEGSALLGDGTSAYGGSETFRIFPKPLTEKEVQENPFIEKIKYLDFMLTNGNNYAIKRIALRQVNYAVQIDDELHNLEHDFIAGKPYSISVKSNAEWTYSVSNREVERMFDYVQRDGETFNFRLKKDLTYGETIHVTIHTINDSEYFPPVNIRIRAIRIFPNSYIVQPGKIVYIPLTPIYDVHKQLTGSEPIGTVTTEIIWKDKTAELVNVGYANNEVWVTTGPTHGNAVIAAKVNNEIVWSWHIWITDYNPDATGQNITYTAEDFTNTFMTRNLGATTGTSNQVENLGLFYQWGRKDPFPGSSTTSAIGSYKTIYDKNNHSISIQTGPVNDLNNQVYAIRNPLHFITSGNYPFDWYTNSRNQQDDFLWNDINNYKTIYDPCPEGWRVPYIRNGVSPWMNIASVNTGSNGVTLPTLGYYPLAGNINYQTGKIESIPIRTFNWLGTPSDEAVRAFSAGYYAIDSQDIRYRANGFNVRCVKDE